MMTYKYFFKADLTTKSPLHIGNGISEENVFGNVDEQTKEKNLSTIRF